MSEQLEAKQLYEMKLHEWLKLMNGSCVTRVPGGWIYENIFDAGVSSVFVPYHADDRICGGELVFTLVS